MEMCHVSYSVRLAVEVFRAVLCETGYGCVSCAI